MPIELLSPPERQSLAWMIRTRLALKLMRCTTWLVARLAPWLPRAETCAEG
jgi:hypothetical protein